MSYHDTDGEYTNFLEMRADYQQQAEEELRRYLEEHPRHEQCPKHPERPVVDSGVCTLRYCAECVENHKRNYTDAMIERDLSRHNDPATWEQSDDMPGCHDRPTNTRNYE